MSKTKNTRLWIQQNAMFRDGGSPRGEDAAVSARQIADHTGASIVYTCATLNAGVQAGHIKRVGDRCGYRYCAA